MILASGGAIGGPLGALSGRLGSLLGLLWAIMDRLGTVFARLEAIWSRLEALLGPQEAQEAEIIDVTSVLLGFRPQMGVVNLGRGMWRSPWGGG